MVHVLSASSIGPLGRSSAALLQLLSCVQAVSAARSSSLQSATSGDRLQARVQALDSAKTNGRETPVSRVVELLKAMQVTIKKDMEDDEALYGKLSCWCQTNRKEKEDAAAASETKLGQLRSAADGLKASQEELKASVGELRENLAADQKALAEATAVQKTQVKEATMTENDLIQGIENLKAAIVVLSEHHNTEAPSPSPPSLEESAPTSLLAVDSLTTDAEEGVSWTEGHEVSHLAQPLEDFMRTAGFTSGSEDDSPADTPDVTPAPDAGSSAATNSRGFLQAEAGDGIDPEEDMDVVQRALHSAAAFLQSHGSSRYVPAYSAQSGEVLGVLKQLKEEMQRDLHAHQTQLRRQGASYQELRASKAEEIQNEQRQEEDKEDDLATTQNNLAETKEDIGQEELDLQETRRFLSDLEVTCTEAAKDFQKRKSSRMQEFEAVSEAVEVLTQDEARDAMSKTYGLVQLATSSRLGNRVRHRAAATLKSAAQRAGDPQLSLLATAVRLDPFVKVKSAIEKMVGVLKMQQEEEVRKKDLCEAELHENDMQSDRTKTEKADLDAKSSQLDSDLHTLEEEIAEARGSIAQQQLALQEAGKDRQAENLEYQRTVQDQLLTAQALKKALGRLEAFYRNEERAAAFVEQGRQAVRGGVGRRGQPVPQKNYEANKGAAGVMQLLAKLIQDAKALTTAARHSEVNAQAAYEQVVEDTNSALGELQKKVATKLKVKGRLKKETLTVESSLGDVSSELQGLTKYGERVHADCDYLLDNFERRQTARREEVDSLRQAKQILTGASLS